MADNTVIAMTPYSIKLEATIHKKSKSQKVKKAYVNAVTQSLLLNTLNRSSAFSGF